MQKNERSRLLLTNDDGYDAPGIQALKRALEEDYEVFLVAPKTQKSGAGCGFTVHNAFTAEARIDAQGKTEGYVVDGTPVDCVKFAHSIVKDFRPDYVLSGINDGGNFGKSFWYSGTIAGAVEATLCGYPAAAISIWNNKAEGRPFDELAGFLKPIIPWLLCQERARDYFWNINLPNTPGLTPNGYRFVKMGGSFYQSTFLKPVEKDGETWYQYDSGAFIREGDDPEADDHILADGYAAISLVSLNPSVSVPVPIARTFEKEINGLMDRESTFA